jgi:hypothetical protein
MSKTGVISFFKTLAKVASSSEFSLAKSENNWPKIQKGSVGGKKIILTRRAIRFVFSLAKSENNWPKIQKGSVGGKKIILTRRAIRFVFLLAKPEIYSHLASWRVVIRTPV